jgi:dienelactone hydrolase
VQRQLEQVTFQDHILDRNLTFFIQAYGFCFGAKKIVQSAHENLFQAMALIHPSFFQAEDADNVTVPVALFPSQGEDQRIMNGFWERIQKKDIAENSVRQDFVRCTYP